jgi:hypothetical protein
LSCIFHHFPLPREKLPEVFFQATDGFPSFSIIFHCPFFLVFFQATAGFSAILRERKPWPGPTWAGLRCHWPFSAFLAESGMQRKRSRWSNDLPSGKLT